MSNFQRCLLLICMSIALALSLGCGGGGGDENFSGDASGVYGCAYNRAGGFVQISIVQNTVNIQVTDDTAGTYAGTGTLANGHFEIDCAKVGGGGSITVEGDIIQLHNGQFQIFLSITGDFVASGTATFQADTVGALYAGTYTGTNSGDLTGGFTMTVHTDGRIGIITHLNSDTKDNTWSGSGQMTNNNPRPEILVNIPDPGGSVVYQPQFSIINGTKHVSGNWIASDWDGEGASAFGSFLGHGGGEH